MLDNWMPCTVLEAAAPPPCKPFSVVPPAVAAALDCRIAARVLSSAKMFQAFSTIKIHTSKHVKYSSTGLPIFVTLVVELACPAPNSRHSTWLHLNFKF
jgi:hypothetical protein